MPDPSEEARVPPRGNVRVQILRLAVEALGAAGGDTATLSVIIKDDAGVTMRYRLQPGKLDGLPATGTDGLSPLERAILGVVTDSPQTAKRLARQLQRPYNSYFRSVLTSLCRRVPPPLMRTADGYRLPPPGS